MPESVARIASIALAGAFVWAAAAKVFAYARWREVLSRYGLPQWIARLAVPLVPTAEAATAVIIVAVSARLGAIVAVGLLAAFSGAILRARSVTGDRLPCGCFGGSRERHYQTMVVRNAFLGTLAAVVLLVRRDVGAVAPDAPVAGESLPVLLVLVGALLLMWTAHQVVSSIRRREHP